MRALLLLSSLSFAGPNQNAKLFVDVDYTTAAIDTLDTAGISGSFWIGVRTEDAVTLDTYGFYLGFDTALLSFAGAYAGISGYVNILETRGGITAGFVGRPSLRDSAKISVAYGLAGRDSSRAPSGSGILALFQFTARGVEGLARFTLSEAQFLDWRQELDTAMALFGGQVFLQRPVPILTFRRRESDRPELRLLNAWRQSPRNSGTILLGRLPPASGKNPRP